NETFLQGAGCFHGSNETFLQGAGCFHRATKPSCKMQGAFTGQRNLPARCRMLSRSNETFLQGAEETKEANTNLTIE
ncbi:hypothetical protein, partial [Tenacibaculum maritimum]|uniref:hypothetical protein n=1 Tax=Tenacibaculum maritimum TaxID=107401 RepID=UPI00387647CB